MPVWLGKYRLLKSFARGGMAEIFLAKQEGPSGYSKTVVLKRILPSLTENEELITMFLDEARLAAHLSHPNIVQVFDFGEVDGSYYLAMEYLAGEDVRAILRAARKKKQRIPVQICCDIIAAACAGLHYAHTYVDETGRALNIVHRDVSPSNVMVTYQGMVKVLDFGIAKAEGKLLKTKTGVLKGKYPYMSPEQAAGYSLDARSDVFALGLVFYEMLTGIRPFRRENDLATLKAVLSEPVIPPHHIRDDVPAEIGRIVAKAVEKKRAARYASAADLRRDVLQVEILPEMGPLGERLSGYLLALMGEERLRARSQIPKDSASDLHSLPGLGGTPTSQSGNAGNGSDRTTARGGPPPSLDDPQPRARRSRPVATLVGLGVLASGGFLAAAWFGPSPPSSTAPAVSPSPSKPSPSPTAEAGPARLEPTEEIVLVKPPPARPVRKPRTLPAAPVKTPDPVAFGTLDVNCIPWCKVFVDEKDIGRNSPARDIRLTAGPHALRVVNPPSGRVRERIVLIEPGQKTREAFRF